MNAARIRQNRLYVVRGRGVARCVRSGDVSSRPTMLWCYEEPVPAEDVVREAAKDDVPARFHHLLFDSEAPELHEQPVIDHPVILETSNVSGG